MMVDRVFQWNPRNFGMIWQRLFFHGLMHIYIPRTVISIYAYLLIWDPFLIKSTGRWAAFASVNLICNDRELKGLCPSDNEPRMCTCVVTSGDTPRWSTTQPGVCFTAPGDSLYHSLLQTQLKLLLYMHV